MINKIKIKDIGEVISGSTPKTNIKEYWNGNNNWITPAELTDKSYLINETERKITDLAIEKSSLKKLPKGTVLLTSRAPIGKVAIANTDMYCNQGFKNIVCNEKIYNKFLYYFLKSKTDYLNSLGRGATFKEISKSIVENIEVSYYEMEEQKKIVKELDNIQKLIDIKEKQLEEYNAMIKSQFIEIFGDPFLNDKKWITNTIGECCTLKSGNSLPSDVENEGGEILYIKVGDMNLKGNEKYITTSSHRVTEKTAGKGIFELGTVLFPKRGGAIGTNKKRITKSKVCADLNIMGVTPSQEIVPEYLYTYFLFIDLGTLNNGSSVPQINNKDIEPLVIQIPPMELQNRFEKFAKQVDKQIFQIEYKIDELKKLKNNLMNKYFN